MNGSLRVKDRHTFEGGRLFQSLKTGWVKVLMDSGEVREYLPKDLIATIETLSSEPASSLERASIEGVGNNDESRE